jgi:hypothetical protein
MTAQMVTRTVTPEMLTAASMLVRIAHPADASMARALGKAEQRLIDLAWTIDCGILQIASHSHPTDVNSTDGESCTCPTSRGCCYHRAAWFILSTIAASGIIPVAPIPLPSVLDDDELPAESFLDGSFDGFADESLLGHDEYGDVIPMAPVAFEEVDYLPVYVPLVQRTPARSVELVPTAGSDFERAQRLADELFAA